MGRGGSDENTRLFRKHSLYRVQLLKLQFLSSVEPLKITSKYSPKPEASRIFFPGVLIVQFSPYPPSPPSRELIMLDLCRPMPTAA
jgi:hypothetical protein